MSVTSLNSQVIEPVATQPIVAPTVRPNSDNESLKVQRRFRLSGNGPASRALQSAILAFLKQRES